ncbi:MAG: CPBP family intramembrane glutamic endopeptidase [Methylovirgula sp.]
MDAAADESRVVKPFGFVGLCLSLIGLAALGLVATALIGVVMAAIAGVVMGWHGLIDAMHQALAHRDEEDVAMRAVFAVILAFHLGLAIAILVAAKWRGGSKWRELIGWQPFRLSDRLIWAIMAGALIYSAAVNGAMDHFLPHPPGQFTIPADPAASVAFLALAVIFAPVTEELLFRGWIYTGLRFHWGLWPALLTTSALFAFAHYEDTHFYALAVFPVGLALGAIRERTGSVKASILFHAINNFAAFCLSALNGG